METTKPTPGNPLSKAGNIKLWNGLVEKIAKGLNADGAKVRENTLREIIAKALGLKHWNAFCAHHDNLGLAAAKKQIPPFTEEPYIEFSYSPNAPEIHTGGSHEIRFHRRPEGGYQHVYIPLPLCEKLGFYAAFAKHTGIDSKYCVGYEREVLFTADGGSWVKARQLWRRKHVVRVPAGIPDDEPCVRFEFDDGDSRFTWSGEAFVPLALCHKEGFERAFEIVANEPRDRIIIFLENDLYTPDGRSVNRENCCDECGVFYPHDAGMKGSYHEVYCSGFKEDDNYVKCKICEDKIFRSDGRRHGTGWIGNCCWHEGLSATR